MLFALVLPVFSPSPQSRPTPTLPRHCSAPKPIRSKLRAEGTYPSVFYTTQSDPKSEIQVYYVKTPKNHTKMHSFRHISSTTAIHTELRAGDTFQKVLYTIGSSEFLGFMSQHRIASDRNLESNSLCNSPTRPKSGANRIPTLLLDIGRPSHFTGRCKMFQGSIFRKVFPVFLSKTWVMSKKRVLDPLR